MPETLEIPIRTHLRPQAVSELGFKKSSYNKCLLFRPGMLLVCFIDDCGLAVNDPSKVDWFVDELRKKGFKLEGEGDFTAFLGVALDKAADRFIHIHQSYHCFQASECQPKLDTCFPGSDWI
jgi:hypothetical protein